ncbi:MAG: hypothetical protein NC177_14740 [Ruminococcus flavefaciens]|nr:hypothetical protein [Ruminococcus flavefaciens]
MAREYLGNENYDYDTADNHSGKKDIWLICYYIRRFNSGYRNEHWNSFGGSDENFVAFVNENAPELKNYFNARTEGNDKYIYFNSQGQPLDLYHCYATLSIYYYSKIEYGFDAGYAKDFFGWAGDLASLLDEAYGLTDKGDNLEYVCSDLLNRQPGTFKNKSSYFSLVDLYADIDSVNLDIRIKNGNNSIEEILNTYYKEPDNDKYCDFISTTDMSIATAADSLNHLAYIYTIVLSENNYSYDQKDFSLCASAFIHFLENEFNMTIN